MDATSVSTDSDLPGFDPHIDRYYSDEFDEVDRLSIDAVGRLERERTKELLLPFLPSIPAHVLDIGGGPGVYAAWLASLGHDVTLIDPVARHREQASVHGTFDVLEGDARALPVPDASADVVLLMGPLYHLLDPADRARALTEARRVTRPGGVIAAAFISRHAAIFDTAAKLAINDDTMYAILGQVLHDGHNPPGSGFTVAHFHTIDEVRADFAAAGLGDPDVYGVEGPLECLLKSGLAEDRPEYFAAAMRAARLLENDPAMLAANAHILAFTRVV